MRSLKLEQLAISTSLLTSNPKIVEALKELRDIAADPIQAMYAADPTHVEEYPGAATAMMTLNGRLTRAFDELESATRQVTAVDFAR
jgi:hypothetical protein